MYNVYRGSYTSGHFIYEMSTSVRFCLSHDCFKWDFIAFLVDIISVENTTLSGMAS